VPVPSDDPPVPAQRPATLNALRRQLGQPVSGRGEQRACPPAAANDVTP